MYRILGQTQYIGNQWKSVGNILVPKWLPEDCWFLADFFCHPPKKIYRRIGISFFGMEHPMHKVITFAAKYGELPRKFG